MSTGGSRHARERERATAELLRADARALVDDAPDIRSALDLLVCDIAFGDGAPAPLRADLGRAVELFRAARGAGPWLVGGAAGLGWVMCRMGVTPPAALDRTVETWVRELPADADADLPRGVLGHGVYALQHPDREFAGRVADGVLDIVSARAVRDADGIAVPVADTPFHRATGQAGHLLVGAAHGAAGLVAHLSAVADAGLPCSPRAADLRDDALPWLLAQRSPVGGSEFPRSPATADVATRSAWCHGDPGVWLGLDAARGRPGVGDVASSTARAVTARPVADTGVLDGSLCHGAAGLVWIGTRIAERHGDSAASTFAADRARRLVDLRAEGPLRYVIRPGGPERSASLLEGDVGAALALLRHVDPAGGRVWEPLLHG